jgi:RNA polymerase sigma factor (sigma-70 family)
VAPFTRSAMTDLRHELDQLYRKHTGALTAHVTRLLGAEQLEAVEAVVHDAFVQAMRTWSRTGLPENPEAWLIAVARNRALDRLRRGGRFVHEAHSEDEGSPVLEGAISEPGSVALRGELRDDLLRMMFVACHPSLPLESRVALTLRTLCGLDPSEIARALLVQEAAIEKRLVRARQKLREERLSFDLPSPADLAERLDSVLLVLYVLFTEGYSAHGGDRHIREELCGEAIRLGSILLEHPLLSAPRVKAAVALMLLQASRLSARMDERGQLLTLAEQDRARWDRALLHRGLRLLANSAQGGELSEYHLEAGIAACHALAPSFERTDWERVVRYYDLLAARDPSPIVRLNRAIAVGYARGPEQGLQEISALEKDARLETTALLPAAAADLRARLGQPPNARAAYERAIDLAATESERQLLQRRLAELS